jgi:hypothetical protein
MSATAITVPFDSLQKLTHSMYKVTTNLHQLQAQGHLTPEGTAGLTAIEEVALTLQALLSEAEPQILKGNS